MRTSIPLLISVLVVAGANGLLGCDNQVEPAGTGGSGPGGGGTGGTGATGTTGGSGGGAGCAACDAASEACVEGACVPIRELTMTAIATLYEVAGEEVLKVAGANACARPATPLEPVILGEEGPCRVFDSAWPEDGFPPEAGNLTAGVPSLGLLALADPDPATAYCQTAAFDQAALFEAGEAIVLQGTGGPMFAAFAHEIAAPEMATVTAGELQRGEPYAVSWTGSASETTILVKASDSERVIDCAVKGPTSITIPGSLTALLPEGETQALVAVSHVNRATHEQDAVSRVTVAARSTGGVIVTYSP